MTSVLGRVRHTPDPSPARRIRRLHGRTRPRPRRIAIGRDEPREIWQHYAYAPREFRRRLGIPDGQVVIDVRVAPDGSGVEVATLPREYLERAVRRARQTLSAS